jgi:hypothetical protein
MKKAHRLKDGLFNHLAMVTLWEDCVESCDPEEILLQPAPMRLAD